MGAITSETDIKVEWLKCSKSCSYFVNNYCMIYDATLCEWIPFDLWAEQEVVLQRLVDNQLNVILKARQLGQTWLVLCFILWKMIFRPVFTALIFSRRENEAIYLLGKQRLRGVYNRLPKWMKVKTVLADASHEWALSNGSIAYGFPTTAGDSYTASFAFVDEADLVPDLAALMNAVKPTIDGGGGMTLLSRADKLTPNSEFKNTYRAGKAGTSPWKATFLPWWVRPGRSEEWYEDQKRDILTRTGALDDLKQQYPATDEEALEPPQLDRRVPYKWITKCFAPVPPITDVYHNLPFLQLFRDMDFKHSYVMGVDPAEGNPGSDDSVATVTDLDTDEEVAVLAGKIEPKVFAGYLVSLSRIFNHAMMMVERNNHGHAVILAITEVYNCSHMLMYGDDQKFGWPTTAKSKDLMYSIGVDDLREGRSIIHCPTTVTQLASIEGATLKAPEGEADDYAVAFMLSRVAASRRPSNGFASSYIAPRPKNRKPSYSLAGARR